MDILARREAVQQALKWTQMLPVYIDTETTGLGPNAEVIEIAILDSDGKLLYQSLVRPKGRIDPEAMRVHGITQAEVAGAPEWADIWPQVESTLLNRKIGIYNSEFDLRMLKQTHQRAWLSWTLPDSAFFCIMKLYARFYGDWDRQRSGYRYHSLENAGRQSGILLPNSHRAQDDALLARELLQYMAAWRG
jgi:DNA polymerase-3 subunit epsilon